MQFQHLPSRPDPTGDPALARSDAGATTGEPGEATGQSREAPPPNAARLEALAGDIRRWAGELGFAEARIADLDLSEAEPRLLEWLQQGMHGSMHYMARHGALRARPGELVPGAVRAICVRMDYLPAATADDWRTQEQKKLDDPDTAVVSLYARGRDYHKVLRQRLQNLASRIAGAIGPFGYRVFTDSAPVMEVELATRAGLGWRGKHTLLLHREAGSMFFLGEILIDLPLPVDAPASAHCGACQACIDACPTGAIIGPARVDARRCISYLTIEHAAAIPEALRPAIGNRIYGCDDCQLVCPWNKYAQRSTLADFDPRHGLDASTLLELFAWDEATFATRTAGSAIHRIGHERWLRNLAVALGNALRRQGATGIGDPAHGGAVRGEILSALHARSGHPSPLVREHVAWAIGQVGAASADASKAHCRVESLR